MWTAAHSIRYPQHTQNMVQWVPGHIKDWGLVHLINYAYYTRHVTLISCMLLLLCVCVCKPRKRSWLYCACYNFVSLKAQYHAEYSAFDPMLWQNATVCVIWCRLSGERKLRNLNLALASVQVGCELAKECLHLCHDCIPHSKGHWPVGASKQNTPSVLSLCHCPV